MSPLTLYFAAACKNPGFFGIPTWYQYLPCNGDMTPQFQSLSDIWLIIAAIIDILLHLGAMIALGIIIYGAFEFITSNGEPEKANKARSTIINGVIGLGITVIASAAVTFLAGQLT